ncbi:fused MFS/spermidine synthase [Egibacter rhizosphaerae]|uniref:fused MFS/spermidine synthase n=1 Tax=Egibacter rhizosphaerae TaxID=1670831 RepID=UPI0013F1444C|nr:fused MFS/spermidine synthase [Egibacter rhizosphaerae]
MPAFLAGLLVFVTSGAVLVLEILAARVLAPYVGDTLQTYTGIIGTVLAGIAIGTWLGGRLADRIDPRHLLGPTIALGGILALLVLPIVGLFGPALAGREVVSILLLAALGFFAPAAVLSAVTPTVVKLQLSTLDETGTVVGRLSALGTAGAILGTFLTGFVLLAAFATRPIVLGLGGLLVVAGIALWWWLAPRRRLASAGVAALAAAALTGLTPVACELESAYHCVQIEEDPDRESGRTLVMDALRHSYVDVDDVAHLEFDYSRAIVAAIESEASNPPHGYHIGGAGLTIPRYLAAEHGTDQVVAEIDPALEALAIDRFGFEPREEPVDVVVADARLDLAGRGDADFDVIVGDAFGGLAVPWHLTTKEFLADVRAALADDGLYTMNLIDHPPQAFARAQARTLAEAFEHAAVLGPAERLDGTEGGNLVLAASDAPLDGLGSAIDRADLDWEVRGNAADWAGDADPLVDEHAPVDQLLTPVPQGARELGL